jgi:hypothetical protein
MVLLIVSSRWSFFFFWHNQGGPFNLSFLWSMIWFSSLQPILLMTNLYVFLQNFGIFFTNTSHCICRLCVFVIIEPNRNRARTSDTLSPSKVTTDCIIALAQLYGVFYKFASSMGYDHNSYCWRSSNCFMESLPLRGYYITTLNCLLYYNMKICFELFERYLPLDIFHKLCSGDLLNCNFWTNRICDWNITIISSSTINL